LHVSAVAGELVKATDHDVAFGRLLDEGLDIASGAKILAEVEQAVQLGLGAGSDDLAVHDGDSPHIAYEAQLVALEFDVVPEALERRQFEAGTVDVDELQLDNKLTVVDHIGWSRRQERLNKLEDRSSCCCKEKI